MVVFFPRFNMQTAYTQALLGTTADKAYPEEAWVEAVAVGPAGALAAKIPPRARRGRRAGGRRGNSELHAEPRGGPLFTRPFGAVGACEGGLSGGGEGAGVTSQVTLRDR